MLSAGLVERGDDDGAGDSPVGGDRQRVAGAVVEPGDDLDGGAVCQRPVAEVGLPELVGQVGGEARIGRSGPLVGAGIDHACVFEEPPDRRGRHGDLVALGEVPADGVRPRVEALGFEL